MEWRSKETRSFELREAEESVKRLQGWGPQRATRVVKYVANAFLELCGVGRVGVGLLSGWLSCAVGE